VIVSVNPFLTEPSRIPRRGRLDGGRLAVYAARDHGRLTLVRMAAAILAGDLPVIGVPCESKALGGMDSLLSIVQMPTGVPVATMSIGLPGATNAALFAAAILSLADPALAARLEEFRAGQTARAMQSELRPS